jgi:2-polyprenyl-3-methyl-5-hydroxy-6-metoxy-1,4-benzoquinol methylase
MEKTRKQHWETIYETKKFEEVSWYQPVPEVGQTIISEFGVEKDKAIIDIGGGDSYLVDFLFNQNYTDISVLDISEKALQRVQNRLESKAEKVHWIASDITEFKPSKKFYFWHDRAVFHFLTDPNDVKKYAEIAADSISEKGIMVIGTFSKNGPLKCSGIEIKQYNEKEMSAVFERDFELVNFREIIHITPMQSEQHFIFCVFRKK